MLQGKIIKGIAGFYYVDTGGAVSGAQAGVYACKAKGIFREEGIKPLPGDDAAFEVTDEKDMEGNIVRILPRKNALVRPEVANVDQALLLFALKEPDPNFLLLDRFLISMKLLNLPLTLVFNKQDIAGEDDAKRIADAYAHCGCSVLFASVKEDAGVDAIKERLKDKTTVIAGPSGVGKSTLINTLYPKAKMETGELSKKIARGRNTTRHSELFRIGEKTYIIDTPGFTSLYIKDVAAKELHTLYPEFAAESGDCRFQGCLHLKEPDCAVKKAVETGRISRLRYDNYLLLYEELSGTRPVYVKRAKTAPGGSRRK